MQNPTFVRDLTHLCVIPVIDIVSETGIKSPFFPAQELPPEGQKLGVGGGDWGKEMARGREEVKTERREELSDSSCGFIMPER